MDVGVGKGDVGIGCWLIMIGRNAESGVYVGVGIGVGEPLKSGVQVGVSVRVAVPVEVGKMTGVNVTVGVAVGWVLVGSKISGLATDPVGGLSASRLWRTAPSFPMTSSL